VLREDAFGGTVRKVPAAVLRVEPFPKPTMTVLLAEDHTIVREGLRLLIETQGDIKIVGEAKTGCEAIQMASDLHPEIVIMDIAMPLMNGIQATQRILKNYPITKVLILSAHSDPQYVEAVLMAGAMGYLIKQASFEILVKAIRELHRGKTFFSPSIAKYLKDEYRKSPDGIGLHRKKEGQLTSRERELLKFIVDGNRNKRIASELGISTKTVEKHRQHLMKKMHIHDIAGLTRFALGAGIIKTPDYSMIQDLPDKSGGDTYSRVPAEKDNLSHSHSGH
jgi:DNA-binding NarL/FixJ family response regulator